MDRKTMLVGAGVVVGLWALYGAAYWYTHRQGDSPAEGATLAPDTIEVDR
jgi:hypothetical protein